MSETRKRVLCYGDSNTWGYMPGTGERYGDDVRWPRICQTILGDSYEILEDGLNGRTTVYDRPWSEGRNGLTGLPYSLLAQMPLDLIVVMLGTNDLAAEGLAKTILGMDEMTRRLVNANEIYRCAPSTIYRDRVRVLLIAPPPYHPVTDTMVDTVECGKYADSLKFAKYYREIADKYGTYFLDAGPYAEVSDIDGIHLTAAGHQTLAQSIADRIREIFTEDAAQ